MLRAVLDANVFVSATLRPTGPPGKVLEAWHAARFHLVISEAILAEIGRVLRYPKIGRRYQVSEDEVRTILDDLRHLAILVWPTRTLHVVTSDASDNRYLECALEGRADCVVTGDRHLLSLGEYGRFRLLTPREFLGRLQP